MKRLFAVVIFSLAISAGAQERVFAPFVSRLTAEVKNNLVRLSWIDSPDVKGPVIIFSSDNPIDPSVISLSSERKPVHVAYGVQSYVDEADYTTRYYFAAASDENGRVYYLSIPLNNIITVNMQDLLRQQAEQAPTVRRTVQGFSLSTVLQEESVIVSFNTDGHSNLILYRNIQPIRKMEDLLSAVIVQVTAESPFIDYPIPGVPCYYAVVPQGSLISGGVRISPGDNATVTPVTISLSEYSLNQSNSALMRPTPLPLVSLSALIGSNSIFNTSPQELSPAAEQAIMDVKRPETPTVMKKPRAFKEDMETPISGEEYTLRSIMQTTFAKRDWTAAREQLSYFLSLPRAEDVELRTRFYLGQVYYFLNMPRESLFEFLLIKIKYPEEAAEWISAVLEILIK
ncbi:MAG: hypothetical protein LBH75_06925 [Treponema sp.]|nr:hypothetical protein [Treponema sp.]